MSDYQFKQLDFTEYPPEEMLRKSQKFYNEIKQRRSVREFSDRAIPAEVIKNAVLAAGSAPSGANQQPWKFIVVSNPEIKRQIRQAAEEVEHKLYTKVAPDDWLNALAPLATDASKPFLETAPCLIVISAKKYALDQQGNKQKVYYSPESVGIATGILLTALHMSGLATLTYTPSPMNFLSRILERPDNERPYMVIVTGFPAENATVQVLEKYPLEHIAELID